MTFRTQYKIFGFLLSGATVEFDATAHTTALKIDSFGRFPAGWHYGKGDPASAQMIQVAKRIHSLYLSSGFDTTDAFLGESGEISITAYQGGHFIEVIAEVNGTYSILYEADDESLLELANLEEAEVRGHVEQIAREIWLGLGSFTQTITTPARESFVVLPSATRRVVVFPLFPAPALMHAGRQFVSTFHNFTQKESPAIPQFFGKLQTKSLCLGHA